MRFSVILFSHITYFPFSYFFLRIPLYAFLNFSFYPPTLFFFCLTVLWSISFSVLSSNLLALSLQIYPGYHWDNLSRVIIIIFNDCIFHFQDFQFVLFQIFLFLFHGCCFLLCHWTVNRLYLSFHVDLYMLTCYLSNLPNTFMMMNFLVCLKFLKKLFLLGYSSVTPFLFTWLIFALALVQMGCTVQTTSHISRLNWTFCSVLMA